MCAYRNKHWGLRLVGSWQQLPVTVEACQGCPGACHLLLSQRLDQHPHVSRSVSRSAAASALRSGSACAMCRKSATIVGSLSPRDVDNPERHRALGVVVEPDTTESHRAVDLYV